MCRPNHLSQRTRQSLKPVLHVVVNGCQSPNRLVLQQRQCFAIAEQRRTRSSAGSERCPPKAEVTGSNPVGCANDFRWLAWFSAVRELLCPDYFRIKCSLWVL